MDDNFSVTHSFVNKGDQVIAIDLFYKIIRKMKKSRPLMVKTEGRIDIYKYHKDDIKKSTSDNKKNDENSETETKKNNNINNSEENFKNNQILYYENDNSGSKNNIKEESEENNDNNKFINTGNVMANSLLNIFLLDIDGNVNYYNEVGIKTIFNLNKVNEIDKVVREKGLFSLNYSYIIKYSHPYLAVSTDNGCYIFQLKHIQTNI